MKYYEINENLARQAKQHWSFFDYETGSKTSEYKQQVDKCYALVEKLPDDIKEKGEALADKYARKLADWYNKQFHIEMMCPSIMISGAGNFPVKKKEKQNLAQDRHYKLYDEIQQIPDKINNLLKGTNIIKSGDVDAIDQLQNKLRKAEILQDEMKTINAYYRKHKTLKGYKEYTDEEAEKLDKAIEDSLYKKPFPPYALSNNNAKIRNIKDRISQLERIKLDANKPKEEYNTELFTVIENSEIMRLQLKFNDKPDVDIRTILKKNGFKFSPKNDNAWQRLLNDNSKYALKRVIREIEKLR